MSDSTFSAFLGQRLLTTGDLATVAEEVKVASDAKPKDPILIFDDQTGKELDLDLRGSLDDVKARYAPDRPHRGPGRPKLGVVAREITLLPSHWDWLNKQPGGASVALRKLVHEAKKADGGARQAQDAAYGFMSAMAGNMPNFEEATRALYSGDKSRFARMIVDWPADIREHAKRLNSSSTPES